MAAKSSPNPLKISASRDRGETVIVVERKPTLLHHEQDAGNTLLGVCNPGVATMKNGKAAGVKGLEKG